MSTPKLQATAVVRKNSTAFVEQVFALYAARLPLVLVADEAQAKTLSGIDIDRCIVPAEQSGWMTAQHDLIHDDTPAQVTYTSGTEGQLKGILLTHANLADAALRIIEKLQMTAEIREYVGVPATYSFGLARYRAISAVGGQAYLSPRGFDPLELSRMLAAGQINALSLVPALLRVLLDTPALIGEAGKYLRWMEIGSQHMTVDEKRRVRAMFPNARIVQHYGLTEASRSTFLTISEASDDLLGSVGRPNGQTEVQLSKDGRIRIRGPHVAKSRIDADGLHDLQDAGGWLQTNDLGHMRDGYLFFEDRADDLINCGGVKIVPNKLEERIYEGLAPGIQIAVAKVPDAQRGDGVLVAVQAGPTEPVRDLTIAALQDIGVAAGSALHIMAVDALPVTGTGKVQRAVLAAQFAAQQSADPRKTPRSKRDISDVLSLFRHEFPGHAVGPEDTFESLGGDSLHYIQFSLSFEQRFGPLPIDWETQSAAELQSHFSENGASIWRRLEAFTVARAFFMICIIALHTGAFVYSENYGAAYFLVLLAGYSVARFQLPEIIRTDSIGTLLGTVRYVAIPTVLMVALLQVLTKKFELTPLLLVSNFLDVDDLTGFTFYFIEFYVQLLVLAAVLFSIPHVRHGFRDRPMISAIVLLLVVSALNLSIEAVWNGDYNYHRSPWNYSWAFALGILLATAKDLPTRLLALGVAAIAAYLKWDLTSAAFYITGGCILVLFIRDFIVPSAVKVLVSEIAGASMFIYLSHYQMIIVVQKLFGKDMPWVALMSSIIAGIVIAYAYMWSERKVIQSMRFAGLNADVRAGSSL